MSQTAILALAGRSISRRGLGQYPEAVEDAELAMDLARQSSDQVALVRALWIRGMHELFEGNEREALAWVRQAVDCLSAEVPGRVVRQVRFGLANVLTTLGEYDAARLVCTTDLAWCREAGDLAGLVDLLASCMYVEERAGNTGALAAYLHEAVDVGTRIGHRGRLRHCLSEGGTLCALTGRWAEAVTLWAANTAEFEHNGLPDTDVNSRRPEFMSRIEAVLDPDQLRAAHERGSRMTLAAAAEFVTLLTEPADPSPADPAPAEGTVPLGSPRSAPGIPGDGELTPRERELVALVAQGRTNSQIAGQLFISVRTVASHLDRIRAKTGARRRADLTRLALQQSLV